MEKVCPSCPEEHKANFLNEILSWKYVQSGVPNIKLVSFCSEVDSVHVNRFESCARDAALEKGRGEF